VNVYIQQTSSNFLYSAKGWVKTVIEADAFESTLAALSHCSREKLTNVHLRVASHGECGYDTIFSVTHFPERKKVAPMNAGD
jgi:hypothetical protein